MTGVTLLARRWAALIALLVPLALLVLLVWIPSWAQPTSSQGNQACAPRVLSINAARAVDGAQGTQGTRGAEGAIATNPGVLSEASARPAQGWAPVVLPDDWSKRWAGHSGSVWYRIEWAKDCPDSAANTEPLALGLSGMSMAGEVFINDSLLWRDVSLVEPLSRSWNMPRFFLLPEPGLHEGVNTVWVRVVGLAGMSPGLGPVQLGRLQDVAQRHDHLQWRQRMVLLINLGLSGAVGCLFLVVWCLRRDERACGWYAAVSLCWVGYVTTLLVTSPWPLTSTLAMSRVNIVIFVMYVVCFCLFTFRFGRQALARTERALWALASLAVVAVVLVPAASAPAVMAGVWIGFLLVFFANCVQFQWHAWRTRDPEHVLLALCWLFLLLVGLRDMAVIFAQWQSSETWAPVTGPIGTLFMSLLLGGRLVRNTRRIERFNHELSDAVARSRSELAEVLAREHTQALRHAKLQERVDISHDLHDGLGGSLVRSMALVEQARPPLTNDRVLSLFKVLRDDLRQVIDQGSGSGGVAPATPTQWAAPLRHRFTRILDELGVASEWRFAEQWNGAPSMQQCLGLTRVVEEALANVIKHSQARLVRVVCEQPLPNQLCLRVEDDGVGFDVAAVTGAGLSIGMRSMQARVDRMAGKLSLVSRPGATALTVELTLPARQ